MEVLQPDGRPLADLTVRELAQQTKQSPQTVYKLCQEGRIPSYRVGRSIRIRREDVAAIRQPKGGLSAAAAAEAAQAVDTWPALTPEQRDAVAAIFASDGGAASD